MDWSESFKKQIRVLEEVAASKQIDVQIKKFAAISKATKGLHYFTGIGKNGFVAANVSSTFNSLGIRSMFIDPVNTLHGDMDIFTKQDIVICISKSGETAELLSFVRALRDRKMKIKVISVTSKPGSRLAKMSDLSIVVPISTEADHLEMAPVASTLAFKAVIQAVAVQLSSEAGFTKKDFVRGHPGGSLGKTVLPDEN